MTDTPTTRWRRVGMAVALVAAGLIGGLGATAANAAFDDVPAEGQYAEAITNLQQAGIATGYSDGSFRPTAAMNRRQTAAWLDRSLSRVGLSNNDLGGDTDSPTLDADHPTATIAEIEMTSPAVGDGSGWITLQGGVGGLAIEGAENCPCSVLIGITNSADEIVARSILSVYDGEGGLAFSTAAVFAITPVPAGETETYTVDVELLDTDAAVIVAGAVYGMYTPIAEGDASTSQLLGGEDGDESVRGTNTDPVESLVPELPIPGAP